MRRPLTIALVGLLLLGGACTAGGDDGADPGDAAAPEATSPSASFPEDPRADGVTADAIRVGITYVDLESLGEVVDIDHGNYEVAYEAVIDAVNADGGINGRAIEPVFAPILPIGTQPADETCVRLTEDENVFAVIGFALDDAPLCYLELHDTPVIGGVITQARLDRAQAPWFSPLPGAESITGRLVEAFVADGAFEAASVGVIALPADQGLMEATTVPALEDNGVDVVDAAIIDAPPDDQTAALQQVGVIAERFRAAGIDTLVTVGNAALTTAQGLEATDYRPRLLATGFESLATYIAGEAGFDPEIVEDAITGGYATSGLQFEDPVMQDCVALVEERTGESLPDPASVSPGDPEPFVSAFTACIHVSLFRQIAEAAGDDLNNGSFGQAGYDLGEVELPGAGGLATYGPDSLDGSMPVYLLRFDAGEGRLTSDTEPAT